MTPLAAHADYSRSRLLRLLDGFDRSPPSAQATTIALPAGLADAEQAIAGENAALIVEHALRSGTGAIIFRDGASAWIVSPPFPVTVYSQAGGFHTPPLRDLLLQPRMVAVVLLRLGGYAIGVYDGDRLIEGRNAARFVKNRHRKGGQSQRRFDRIREKQVDELFAHLCRDAAERLAPYRERLDFLAYGGDRHAVQACLKECRSLREFSVPVLPRFLTVPEPRHETLVVLPALLTSSRVTTITTGKEGRIPGNRTSDLPGTPENGIAELDGADAR